MKYSPAGRSRSLGLNVIHGRVACISPFHSHILQMESGCYSGLFQSQTQICLWMFCRRKKKTFSEQFQICIPVLQEYSASNTKLNQMLRNTALNLRSLILCLAFYQHAHLRRFQMMIRVPVESVAKFALMALSSQSSSSSVWNREKRRISWRLAVCCDSGRSERKGQG